MSLSLNEVEATAKRAARGAGYPWGLAEEAAKATRWLCARNIDGCAALADLLAQIDGSDVTDWAPGPDGEIWESHAGTLCPLVTGAVISDRAVDLRNVEFQTGRVAVPILLLPFAALAAQQLGASVTIAWQGTVATTDGDRLSIDGAPSDAAERITVRTGGEISHPMQVCTRADPKPGAIETLNRFSGRTYAPATEESRLRGAGAGLSDND